MAGVTSSYPAALDSESNLTPPNNGDTLSVADHWLAGNSGPIVAIETELGTDPAGSHTNVKNRLDQVDSAMGFKNRIIGGNFSTNPWQRGTSFTAPTMDYTADRFTLYDNTSGVVDVLKTADAPTIVEAGVFTQHCFHVDVTTADSSISSSDECHMWQAIEGYNLLDLGFGQSGTRYFTLSFWHKHTKTGTNCVAFRNVDASKRTYVAEYTQSVSDTWEKAEITVPVDTSGTWNYTNGQGLYVFFSIAMGSTRHTTAGSWQSGDFRSTSNQVNNLDSTSNNFKIALIQLEAGDKATRFETRSVGQELALCQRYYQKSYNVNIPPGTANSTLGYILSFAHNTYTLQDGTIRLPLSMRSSPDVYLYSAVTGAVGKIRDVSAAADVNVLSLNMGENGFEVGGNNNLTANNYYTFNYAVEAEL